MRLVKKFDGGYGILSGKIWVELHECTICGKEEICIASDASEHEYRCAWLCLACVDEAIRDGGR